MKKLFLFAFAAFALAACSDDEPQNPNTKFDVISFEDAEGMVNLKTNKTAVLKDVTMDLYGIGTHTYGQVFCGQEYATAETAFDALFFATKNGEVRFGSYYANGFDNWGGFALSRNYDKTATKTDLRNQFSAWTTSGANGSKTCMVGYDSSFQPNSYALPVIEFTSARKVDHLWMANATMTYAYAPSAAVPQGETYYYKVVITGSLKGVTKGTVECVLVTGSTKQADWKKFSLAALGEVDKLVFKPASNDKNDYGVLAPTYFAIDDIALVRK